MIPICPTIYTQLMGKVGLNSDFSFSYTGCCTKDKLLNLPEIADCEEKTYLCLFKFINLKWFEQDGFGIKWPMKVGMPLNK